MIDATILIPTFRHAALLLYSVRSALDQADATVEVFVVGDGVEDDTRAALEPFADDERVRFFDFPKGARHGELNRHEALHEATGEIVCYLSDDDLLLRDHAAAMRLLLENADFAHSISARLELAGTIEYFPWNLSRPEFVEVGLNRKASIGLTGTAHTPRRIAGSRSAGERLRWVGRPITTCGASGSSSPAFAAQWESDSRT